MGSPIGDDEDLFLFSGGPILADQGYNIIGSMENVDETVFGAAAHSSQFGVESHFAAFRRRYGGQTDAYMVSACDPLSPAIDALGDPSR